jgi:ribulose-phosphate 3-epimerase
MREAERVRSNVLGWQTTLPFLFSAFLFSCFSDFPYHTPMLDLSRPPKHTYLAASILSADFGRMAEDCRSVLDLGADLLHVDVMDGHFAPNLTMGADMLKGVRRHLPDAFLDAHLMVEFPGDYIESFAKAGANNFSFHMEVCKPFRADGADAGELIKHIRDAGMSPGMVVNPPTTIAQLDAGIGPYLDDLVMVLVMSVNPGFSGQKFMPEVLDKARWLKERISKGTRIQMDGGLNTETLPSAVAAGVDVTVTATALFGEPDRAAAIKAIRAASA